MASTSPEKPLILETLSGLSTPRPAVWFMRQAGRYMEDYRNLKAEHGFLTMCQTPSLACEVSMQPIRYLDVDAAIIFSDIMIPAQALGIEIEFNPGPIIKNPIVDSSSVSALNLLDVRSHCDFVFEAISKLKAELKSHCQQNGLREKALIGFAATPWTLACYLIEQGIYKHFKGSVIFARKNPEAFSELLDLLVELTAEYLIAQVEAGADVLQMFDSWGGILAPEDYKSFSLKYSERVLKKVKEKTNCPVILYVGDTSHLTSILMGSDFDALSVDWKVSISELLSKSKKVIQGNLDPTLLFAPKEQVLTALKELLSEVSPHSNFILNLGHGILPQTPPETVKAIVDAVKNI